MSNAIDEFRRERLSALAERVGGKAALGKLLGYQDGAFVGQMIKGHRPISEKTVLAVHAKPGLSGWFSSTTIDGEPKRQAFDTDNTSQDHRVMESVHSYNTAAEAENTRIPEFDTGGKMGHGLVLRDQPGVIRSWTVSDSWLQQNVHRITAARNLAIVTGFGDSMRPLFHPGDPLLLDRGITRVDVDGVYFFRVGDEGYVKRLQRIPTANGPILRAKSENDRYDPFDIVAGMDFEVFGRVVKAWAGVDF